MNITIIVRRLINSEIIYNFLRRIYLVYIRFSKIPHEKDFDFYRYFDGEEGIFVDVGANGGQSAISFSCFNSSFKIVSFEPNTTLERDLHFAKKLLGPRYSYHMHGLGESAGTFTLYTPYIGALPIAARASMRKEGLTSFLDEMDKASHKNVGFKSSSIEIRDFDSTSIAPTIVKIDVEGHETEVLRGMSRAISKHRPIFMIEKSDSYEKCCEILRNLDYRIFGYDPKQHVLRNLEAISGAINFFAVPNEKMPDLRKRKAVAE